MNWELEQQKNEIKEARKQRENDRILDLAKFEAEREEIAKIDYQKRMASAMTYLDRMNSTGNAHSNFHGIADASSIHDIAQNTVRDNYIKHRNQKANATLLQPLCEIQNNLDSTTFLEGLDHS